MTRRLLLLTLMTWLVAGAASARASAAEAATTPPEPVPVAALPAAATVSDARGGPVALDTGLVIARPALLGTGMVRGVAAGVSGAGWLTWGLRAAWGQALEYTEHWAITDNEVRLRAVGLLQGNAGRGTWALRLGVGASAIYTTRDRAQAGRLGAAGSTEELHTTAWTLAPGGELEVGVTLRVVGTWGLALFVGPSLHHARGDTIVGWGGHVGLAWLP